MSRTAAPASKPKGYGAGARLLSAGIALTGVVTFAYFSVASYALTEVEYTRVALLWAVVVVLMIVRPGSTTGA